MKNTGLFKFIIFYLKSHIKTVILFCIFTLIFAAIFYLYGLSVDAVAYSALLCLCTGMVFMAVDCRYYYKKHKLLVHALDRIDYTVEELPTPADIIEKDYQSLITAIHKNRMQIISYADNEKSNMTDYYTLWAHQIKTPISAMRLLLQTEENERNSALFVELFLIEQYVEMVLGYLRMDSVASDYVIKNYKLDDIVKSAVRKYAKLFVLKKISLDYKELNIEVLTDLKWTGFVIEQILSNALKYTNKGKISVYMDPAGTKTLIIEDTGIGIQAEDLPRVFDNGFTGYNGRTDKKSTGIGLYLCKRILSKLSHTIEIESVVGKGTKVKIGFETVEYIK